MEARIRFYNIQQCGYYEKDAFCFGGISDILDNLTEWIKDKTLDETRTYSVNPDENESDILSTYCYSVTKKNNDFLLITWNQNADVNGKMAAVNIFEKTGEASVETAEPSTGFIPGYPSFFWFIPNKNIFATVQINTNLNGKKNLDHYLRCFLDHFSQYVVYKEVNGKYEIIGYGTEDDYSKSKHPHFSSALHKEKGKLDYIRQNRESISKFVKKDKLLLKRPETLQLWQVLYRLLFAGKQNSSDCVTENEIKFEMNFTPSEAVLEEMISKWQQDVEQYPKADVGFWIKGNSQPFWLSRSLASDTFDLDIHFLDKDVLVKADDLLSELHRKQDIIFKVLES